MVLDVHLLPFYGVDNGDDNGDDNGVDNGDDNGDDDGDDNSELRLALVMIIVHGMMASVDNDNDVMVTDDGGD